MTLAEQYDAQHKRALLAIQFGLAKEVLLVVQRFPGRGPPPIVSVVGSSIPRCMVDLWREQGVAVFVIEVLTMRDVAK